MDPITIAAITTVISHLAGKAFNKAFETTTEEFTKGSLSWLKSVFMENDGSPKEIMEELEQEPENELNKESAILAIKKSIQTEPKAQEWIKEIAQVLENKQLKNGQKTIVSNSKNVNTGTIHAGGNAIIGDNNSNIQ